MSNTIQYDITTDPSPLVIEAKATVNQSAFSVQIVNIPSVSFSLRPTGNFIQEILSGILYPVAGIVSEALALGINAFAHQLQKNAFNLPIKAFPVSGLTVQPINLSLGSASIAGTDMIKLTGDVTVAPATNSEK